MNKIFNKAVVSIMLVAGALAMTVSDADAKRLGGGGSIGRQSSNVSRQAAPPANNPGSNLNQTKPAAPAAAPAPGAVPPKPASPWKGIVGGLIGGALLGAMFSHFGLGGALGGALGSILTIALLAFAVIFIIRMFRRNSGNNGSSSAPSAFSQPSYAGVPSNTPEIGSRIEPATQTSSFNTSAAAPVAAAPWGVPADFDVPAFLRNSKTYFIRLQAAWDKADISDIREFTSTEMYAEIKLQIQERGASPNVTDVVSIDAELMGLETIGNDYLASVKFSGMIKEAANAPAEAFNEVWNLSKPINGQGGWVLAGIQQL